MQSTGDSQMFPIEKSNLYQLFMLEHEQIMRHKWFLSEKAGYDIGMTYAVHNWNWVHRPGWISMIKASGKL